MNGSLIEVLSRSLSDGSQQSDANHKTAGPFNQHDLRWLLKHCDASQECFQFLFTYKQALKMVLLLATGTQQYIIHLLEQREARKHDMWSSLSDLESVCLFVCLLAAL